MVRFAFTSFFVLFSLTVVLSQSGYSQTEPTEELSHTDDSQVLQVSNIQIGLNGVWKVGYPTRFSFEVSLPSSLTAVGDSVGTALIHTVDGEGIDVSYEIPLQLADSVLANSGDIDASSQQAVGNRMFRFETAVVHGRPNRGIELSIERPSISEKGSKRNYMLSYRSGEEPSEVNSKVSERISVSERLRGKILPASQPWVVGIGSNLNLDQVAQKSAQGRLPSYVSTEVSDVNMLPTHHQAYRGIDLLILPTNPSNIIDGMNKRQQLAIQQSVREGGYLQVWGGANTSRIGEWNWLRQIMPAEQIGIAPDSEPGTIESYLSSQKRLDRLTLGKFKLKDGVVDLIDRSKLPLIIRGAYGFGQVQIFAGDLNQRPLSEWSDRKLLLEKLLVDSIEAPRKIQTGSPSQVAVLGYDDLAGQVKSWLDVFPTVQSGNLLAMAAVLILLIALIGPFDYFVIQRALQKPIWTWWSLALWSCLSISLLMVIANWWKPNLQMINSIEIVDVDYSTQTYRGSAFLSQYVGKAGNFGLTATARRLFAATEAGTNAEPNAVGDNPSLTPMDSNSVTNTVGGEEKKKSPVFLTWSGQPGAGLGGFDSNVRTDFGYPAYSVLEKEIQKLGIPTAGTKSLVAEWNRESLPEWSESHFEILQGSDFLEGVWVNPLSEELLEPILIYRGWIYRLPSKIRPGGEVRIAASDIPKDLTRYLQRRKATKDSELGQVWDPSGGESVDRIVDIVSMYRAAGGLGYVGLSHRYLGKLDLSPLANLNRAIILGRLNDPIIDLTLKQVTEKLVVRNSNRAAFVRFVLPVAVKQP